MAMSKIEWSGDMDDTLLAHVRAVHPDVKLLVIDQQFDMIDVSEIPDYPPMSAFTGLAFPQRIERDSFREAAWAIMASDDEPECLRDEE